MAKGKAFFIFLFFFILIHTYYPTGLVCPSVSYSSIFLFFDTSIVFSSFPLASSFSHGSANYPAYQPRLHTLTTQRETTQPPSWRN